jgi:FAD/FMN-containing dehydrogenase
MTEIAARRTTLAGPHASQQPDLRAERLRGLCGDFVHLPGDEAYDAGRRPWNVAVSQLPAAVAEPTTVEEISLLVRVAAALGLRVTAQSTGHAAGILAAHRLDDVVLVRTGHLRGVYVDPYNQVARVEAGASWEDVIDVAAPHGLTALHGSAPDVGVVGYTLGGGLGWYARKHGLATNGVVGIELVGADGEVVRADASTNPELFWALRGGGGNFGIVTTIEIGLLPIADVHAGMMLWDISRAPEVLPVFAAWSRTAPEEVTTSFRIMRFPPIPELPDFLRGRSVVVLDGAALLPDEDAAEVLAPFRDLDPELDTFARVPAASLTRLHMDPENPTPAVGAGIVLEHLDDAAVEAFLASVGPDASTTVFVAELRQLGGALGRPAADGGALDSLPGSHLALFIAMAPTPEIAAAGEATIDAVLEALEPWRSERPFLNLVERPVDPRTAFGDEGWQRLQAVKRAVDPGELFLGNHRIRGDA